MKREVSLFDFAKAEPPRVEVKFRYRRAWIGLADTRMSGREKWYEALDGLPEEVAEFNRRDPHTHHWIEEQAVHP